MTTIRHQSYQSTPSLEGQQFGYWTVIKLNVEKTKTNKEKYWDCICKCGKISTVYGFSLRSGHTTSCGCIKKSKLLERRQIVSLKNLSIFFEFKNFLESYVDSVDTNKNIELAWAAGFFDGEGCTTLTTSKNNTSIRASIAQVEINPLQRFLNAVEYGGIRGPYKYSTNKQSHYQWNASGGDVIKTITKLWPYLSVIKRKQAVININNYCSYLEEVRNRKV